MVRKGGLIFLQKDHLTAPGPARKQKWSTCNKLHHHHNQLTNHVPFFWGVLCFATNHGSLSLVANKRNEVGSGIALGQIAIKWDHNVDHDQENWARHSPNEWMDAWANGVGAEYGGGGISVPLTRRRNSLLNSLSSDEKDIKVLIEVEYTDCRYLNLKRWCL